jgi:hypothetical protein
MEDDQLVIRYQNGAPCSHGGTLSTLIVLTCSDANPGAAVSLFSLVV